jgi:hypothetical protein
VRPRVRTTSLFAIGLFVATLVLSQTVDWKEHAYPDDGFAIAAPSEPTFQKQIMKAVPGEVEAHIYIVPLKNAQLMLICATLHPNDKRTPEEVLSDAKKVVNVTDSKLAFEKKISLGEHPGIEIELEDAQYHQHSRAYLLDRRVYTLVAATYKNLPFPPEMQRWYESFRLLSKPK